MGHGRCVSGFVLVALWVLLVFMNPFETWAAAEGCATFDAGSSTLHVPCLSLGGTPYSLDMRLAKGSYVITVDGLSFDAFIPGYVSPPSTTPPYLWVALSSPPISLGNGDGVTLLPYQWSRDASQTAQVVDDLRKVLRQNYAKAKSEDKRLVIVAHSWGTVLTFLALALESAGNDPIASDLYVTLGSPIGAGNVVSAPDFMSTAVSGLVRDYTAGWIAGVLSSGNCMTCLPKINGSWKNYWAITDYLSGPLSPTFAPVIDTQVDPQAGQGARPVFSEQSTGYWHEFTSLRCGDYCTIGDNLWLQNEIKTLVQAVTKGLVVEKVGFSSMPVSSPQCATVDLATYVLHLPCMEFGGATWWVDLQAVSFGPVAFALKSYGAN